MYRRYSQNNFSQNRTFNRQPQPTSPPVPQKEQQPQNISAQQQPKRQVTHPNPRRQTKKSNQADCPQSTCPSQEPNNANNNPASTNACCEQRPKPSSNGLTGVLSNLIPKGMYNPETKKILGLLSAEDLLLIALIFLFLEDSADDNPLIALALIYVLISDYIDLGDFSF